MIEERYCSYEVALLLREKGFDWNCITYYVDSKPNDIQYSMLFENNTTWEKRCCSAPTHQMACDWLREVHQICITIYPDKEKGFEAVLYNIESDVEITLQSLGVYGFHIFESSYGKAVEVALKYVLENLI